MRCEIVIYNLRRYIFMIFQCLFIFFLNLFMHKGMELSIVHYVNKVTLSITGVRLNTSILTERVF